MASTSGSRMGENVSRLLSEVDRNAPEHRRKVEEKCCRVITDCSIMDRSKIDHYCENCCECSRFTNSCKYSRLYVVEQKREMFFINLFYNFKCLFLHLGRISTYPICFNSRSAVLYMTKLMP